MRVPCDNCRFAPPRVASIEWRSKCRRTRWRGSLHSQSTSVRGLMTQRCPLLPLLHTRMAGQRRCRAYLPCLRKPFIPRRPLSSAGNICILAHVDHGKTTCVVPAAGCIVARFGFYDAFRALFYGSSRPHPPPPHSPIHSLHPAHLYSRPQADRLPHQQQRHHLAEAGGQSAVHGQHVRCVRGGGAVEPGTVEWTRRVASSRSRGTPAPVVSLFTLPPHAVTTLFHAPPPRCVSVQRGGAAARHHHEVVGDHAASHGRAIQGAARARRGGGGGARGCCSGERRRRRGSRRGGSDGTGKPVGSRRRRGRIGGGGRGCVGGDAVCRGARPRAVPRQPHRLARTRGLFHGRCYRRPVRGEWGGLRARGGALHARALPSLHARALRSSHQPPARNPCHLSPPNTQPHPTPTPTYLAACAMARW